MQTDGAIKLLATWLDAVHIESAPARVDERRAEYLEDEARHGPITPTAISSAALFRVALHEAAHATLACQSDIGVTRAVLLNSETGSVRYATDPKDHPIAAVIVHLAGVAIELLTGADERRQFHLAHSSDVQAARLAIDSCLLRISAHTCAGMAVCAVSEQFGTILRVAKALCALGELDGPTINALCGAAQRTFCIELFPRALLASGAR